MKGYCYDIIQAIGVAVTQKVNVVPQEAFEPTFDEM